MEPKIWSSAQVLLQYNNNKNVILQPQAIKDLAKELKKLAKKQDTNSHINIPFNGDTVVFPDGLCAQNAYNRLAALIEPQNSLSFGSFMLVSGDAFFEAILDVVPEKFQSTKLDIVPLVDQAKHFMEREAVSSTFEEHLLPLFNKVAAQQKRGISLN